MVKVNLGFWGYEKDLIYFFYSHQIILHLPIFSYYINICMPIAQQHLLSHVVFVNILNKKRKLFNYAFDSMISNKNVVRGGGT